MLAQVYSLQMNTLMK